MGLYKLNYQIFDSIARTILENDLSEWEYGGSSGIPSQTN